jgi:DNA-directed RNA polymerase specialized sigma24 family protein
MRIDDRLTPLARQAQSGDRQAANDLVIKVAPWTRWKAQQYAKSHGVDAEELYAVGQAVFPAVLRDYKPSAGGFLNYYAAAAARAMLKAARKDMAREMREAGRATEIGYTLPAYDLEPDLWRDAIAELAPVDRVIVTEIVGLDVPAQRRRAVAARLGLSIKRVQARFRKALEQLSASRELTG